MNKLVNRNSDRSGKNEAGPNHRQLQHNPQHRYQRFHNHYRKFLPNNKLHNSNSASSEINFNNSEGYKDYDRDEFGGDDYWDEDAKRHFNEWKKFQRYSYGPDSTLENVLNLFLIFFFHFAGTFSTSAFCNG